MYAREECYHEKPYQEVGDWGLVNIFLADETGSGGKRDAVRVIQGPTPSKTANKEPRCSDSALQLVAELTSQHEIPSTPKRCGWCPSVVSDESYRCTTAKMHSGYRPQTKVEETSRVRGIPYGLVFEMLCRHDDEMPPLPKRVLLLGRLCPGRRSISSSPLGSKWHQSTQASYG